MKHGHHDNGIDPGIGQAEQLDRTPARWIGVPETAPRIAWSEERIE